MREKCFRKIIISLGAAAVITGAAGLSFCTPFKAFADEPAITQDHINDINEKKAELDREQAEYDEALKDQQYARDVVVNAERALEDARGKYEDVMTRYGTGFYGFLEWLSDNETDPEKTEDLRNASWYLQWLDGNYDEYYEENGIEPDSIYFLNNLNANHPDVLYEEALVNSRDPLNITRIYHTIPYLEALAEEIDTKEGVSVGIRLDFLVECMEKMRKIVSHGSEELVNIDTRSWSLQRNYGDVSSLESYADERQYPWTSAGDIASGNYSQVLSYFDPFNSLVTHGVVQFLGTNSYDDENVPALSEIRPSELLNPKVLGIESSDKYIQFLNDGKYDEEKDLGYYAPSNVIMGISCGGLADGADYIKWEFHDGDRYYSNDENGIPFITPIKGTYSLREYIQLLKEYYAMVDPGPAMLVLDQTNNDLDEAQRTLEAMDSDLLSKLGRLKDAQREYEEAVALLEEQEAAALFGTPEATATFEGQESVLLLEEDDEAVWSGESGTALQILSSSDETVPLSEQTLQPEAEKMENEETSDLLSAFAFPAVISYSEKEIDVSGNMTGTDTEDLLKEERREDHILAEVLTYVFNGGAIAFIVPSGFIRRKKRKMLPV